MKFPLLIAAALLLPAAALANQSLPWANVPSLSDLEQGSIQDLTGFNGTPISLGPPPTLSGSCSTNTQLGGSSTGSFKANGACAAGTVIITLPYATANGYKCDAKDLTTPANTLTPSAYTTTTFTFSPVTLTADDIVVFQCEAF